MLLPYLRVVMSIFRCLVKMGMK
uniref:Uncharacterized protein n=1 Tax=Arundo donax TaxID=35708 RepID=A0A0A8ZVG4_ARUDO